MEPAEELVLEGIGCCREGGGWVQNGGDLGGGGGLTRGKAAEDNTLFLFRGATDKAQEEFAGVALDKEKQTEDFLAAAKEGDLERVKELIPCDANVKAKTELEALL